ncbi:MAG: urease accessory protein UreD [Rhizobiaceae bacterium]|jgi:urease accessory protein|nr:urease accessory protein UreD [Rhizobiaceae bacterium]
MSAVHPIRMQRAEGEGAISVSVKGGRTRLDTLYQKGQAKIRVPETHDGTHLEAVLINVSGGMTGGDRFAWRAEASRDSSLSVTTQACEKLYRADDGFAESRATLHVADGAALAWLPQEAILFDRAALTRIVDADIAPGGRLLVLESAILGRAAMGETVRQMALRDRWRIRCGGTLIHAEETMLAGDPAVTAAGPARLGGMTAFASLVLVTPEAARWLAPLRALPLVDGATFAASAFHPAGALQSGKLVARFAATDGLTLRRALIPAVDLLNRQALGLAGLPKVWRL